MIYIYRLIINIILIFSPLIILLRLINKKEDIKRFKEKFSFASKERKKGKLIWFHAASVGEFLSIVSLIKKLESNKKISQILLTTSTLTSSKLFAKFKFKKTIHQFFPIDANIVSRRFLNFWKPDLAIFVDSEIWPNTLLNLKERSIKRILLNARISKRSFKKWKKLGKFSKSIFQIFNYTYPQNSESKDHLQKIGVNNIKNLGNLKFSQNNFNTYKSNKNFNKLIKSKKIWCAASTHPGEEELCLEIHLKLIKRYPNLLLILIPRHVERINDLRRDLIKYNLKYHIHSDNRSINKETKLYIVDTYGETGHFFKKCKIVFLGKSLTVEGGQNPLEPARDNCLIIHGPKVSNFKEIYYNLNKSKIAFKISNSNQLYKKIGNLLRNTKKNSKTKNQINLLGSKILSNNLNEIRQYI